VRWRLSLALGDLPYNPSAALAPSPGAARAAAGNGAGRSAA